MALAHSRLLWCGNLFSPGFVSFTLYKFLSSHAKSRLPLNAISRRIAWSFLISRGACALPSSTGRKSIFSRSVKFLCRGLSAPCFLFSELCVLHRNNGKCGRSAHVTSLELGSHALCFSAYWDNCNCEFRRAFCASQRTSRDSYPTRVSIHTQRRPSLRTNQPPCHVIT